MARGFDPETVGSVLKGSGPEGEELERTPLSVVYKPNPNKYSRDPGTFSDPQAVDPEDKAKFNAVGSRIRSAGSSAQAQHLPIVDVRGRVESQSHMVRGSKVVVGISYADTTNDIGTNYSPRSLLRDVLGDNGIDTEVSEPANTLFDRLNGAERGLGHSSLTLALRSREPGAFYVADSGEEGHGHLYIQTAFSETDYSTLIAELGELGVISPAWQRFTEEHGMGIVRTPWTEAQPIANPYA